MSLRSHFVAVWEMCWSLPDAEKLNVMDRQTAGGGSFKKQSRCTQSLRIDLVKHDPITSRDCARSNAGFQPFACAKLIPVSSQ